MIGYAYAYPHRERAVGINRRIGWKRGAWHDVGWWQLELTPAGAEPPAEPLSPDPPPPPG